MWRGKTLFSLASRPACHLSPPLLLMLCTESCVCCHTALKLIQGGAVRSDCSPCLARLLCAVLDVIDCLLLGSFPWICSQWTVSSPWHPKQSCGSFVGPLTVPALVFLSVAFPWISLCSLTHTWVLTALCVLGTWGLSLFFCSLLWTSGFSIWCLACPNGTLVFEIGFSCFPLWVTPAIAKSPFSISLCSDTQGCCFYPLSFSGI